SQVTIGAQNDNGFRVIGDKGTVEWSLPDHLNLRLARAGQPLTIYRLGAEYVYFPASVKPYLRLPSGHPEGFHEALANLHRTMEYQIRRKRTRMNPRPVPLPYADDGLAAKLRRASGRSEEHTSQLQPRGQLLCRLL